MIRFVASGSVGFCSRGLESTFEHPRETPTVIRRTPIVTLPFPASLPDSLPRARARFEEVAAAGTIEGMWFGRTPSEKRDLFALVGAAHAF